MIDDLRQWQLPAERFGQVLKATHELGLDAAPSLLTLAGRVTRHSLSAYSGFSELWRGPIRSGTLPHPAAEALLDAILDPIDEELQALYRAYLRGIRGDLSSWQRVMALEAVRPAAQAIVDRYDWSWLARWFGHASGDPTWCLLRLSNRAFPCRRVTFRFTYHCNITCRHCYNDSGPNRGNDRLKLDDMRAVIRDMPGVGIPLLTLTGGEPLLYAGDVVALIREARRAGLAGISLFTNGFWGGTPAGAGRMLQRLGEAGFGEGPADSMKVSAGAFHQEYVDPAVVANIATAYFSRFGRPLEVDVETDAGGEGLAPVQAGLAERAAGVPVAMSVRQVSGLGRGRAVAAPAGGDADLPCHLIDQVVFDPEGSCRPCCGLNAENFGVRVGLLGQESLPTLVKRIQNDALLQAIATAPMRGLFDLTWAELPESRRRCELCQAAIGGVVDRESLLSRLESRRRYYPFWFRPRG